MSPFKDETHIYLEWSVEAEFSCTTFNKLIGSVLLVPNHSENFLLGKIWIFAEGIFLDPSEIGVLGLIWFYAVVTLHFDVLVVNNYNFFYMSALFCEKYQIFLLSTFDQYKVFLIKYLKGQV